MTRSRERTMDVSLEELGKSHRASLEVRVEYDWEDAEPAVMYYRDGSGYPGSPGGATLTAFHVTEYRHIPRWVSTDEWFENGRTVERVTKRAERPDWFLFLDAIAEKLMLGEAGLWEQAACELVAKSLEDHR